MVNRSGTANGERYGISWREMAFIGPFIAVTIIGALSLGGNEKQVSVNTDVLKTHTDDIKAIVQHDANTTADLRGLQRQLDELKVSMERVQARISALHLEFITLPQFKEYKDGTLNQIAARDRLIDLMQKEVEDINKQIAAAIATQQPFGGHQHPP